MNDSKITYDMIMHLLMIITQNMKLSLGDISISGHKKIAIIMLYIVLSQAYDLHSLSNNDCQITMIVKGLWEDNHKVIKLSPLNVSQVPIAYMVFSQDYGVNS